MYSFAKQNIISWHEVLRCNKVRCQKESTECTRDRNFLPLSLGEAMCLDYGCEDPVIS